MHGTMCSPSATPKRPPSGLVALFGAKSRCMSITSSASRGVIAPTGNRFYAQTGPVWTGPTGTSFLPEETVERAEKGSPVEKAKLAKDPSSIYNDVYEYARAVRSGEMEWTDIEKADFNVRAKWVGLVHRDKQTPGRFMMRLRLPNGITNADSMRFYADCVEPYGDDIGVLDITTRQNIQLRGVAIEDADKILDGLHARGQTSFQSALDNVRNMVGSPLAGIDEHEMVDTRPFCDALNDLISLNKETGMRGNPEWSNLPRKFNIAVSGGRDVQCWLYRAALLPVNASDDVPDGGTLYLASFFHAALQMVNGEVGLGGDPEFAHEYVLVLLSSGLSRERVWRTAFGLGGALSAVGVILRWRIMHETEAFEAVRKRRSGGGRRQDGADESTGLFESSPEYLAIPLGPSSPPADASDVSRSSRWATLLLHWRPLLGTAGSWLLYDAVDYGLGLYTADFDTLLGLRDDDRGRALGVLYIALLTLPGYWIGVALVESRLGRRGCQLLGFCGMAVVFFLLVGLWEPLQRMPVLLLRRAFGRDTRM